jgi:hypothetical protein
MAIFWHIFIYLLKSETEHKVGIKIKLQITGYNHNYLRKVLQIFYMRLL